MSDPRKPIPPIPISALEAALAGPGAHPPIERLAATAAGELLAAEAAAIEAHAATCAACGAELELARGFAAAPADDADVRWVVERLGAGAERAAGAPPLAKILPMRGPSAPARRWTVWAAAASVVLAAALGLTALRDARPPALPERPLKDVVRGGEIVWQTPTGALAEAPEIFAWEPVAGAARYRIEILDVLGARVAGAEVGEPRWAPSAAERVALESFVTYRVRLVALDPAGGEVAGSVTELRVEPAP
jgi:hypothetical protein